MLIEKVEQLFDRGELDDAYMDFIMANADGSRAICNGDTLLDAFEDGYMLTEFMQSYATNH